MYASEAVLAVQQLLGKDGKSSIDSDFVLSLFPGYKLCEISSRVVVFPIVNSIQATEGLGEERML
jgi:hypothetical protein